MPVYHHRERHKCYRHFWSTNATPLNKVKNRFYIMRHGNSLANQAGIVVSDPTNGVDGYGLSTLGVAQVQAAVDDNTELDAKTRIYSSDFARARQTAELVGAALGTAGVTTTPLLRERYFGEYELGPDTIYEEVWQRDIEDSGQNVRGVESVNLVMKRALELTSTLDSEHNDASILFVAHGDILQILLTAFSGKEASQHRSIKHLETAEIRRLA